MVASIHPDGPAYGLLQEGDVVESINGITTKNLSHHAVPRIIGRQNPLHLRIKRILSPLRNVGSFDGDDLSGTPKVRPKFIAETGMIGTPVPSVTHELRRRATARLLVTPEHRKPPDFSETPLPGSTPTHHTENSPLQKPLPIDMLTSNFESADEIIPLKRHQVTANATTTRLIRANNLLV